MFTFSTAGVVTGLNQSDDGRKVYLRVQGDKVTGLELTKDEEADTLSIVLPSDKVPAGLSFGTRVTISGVGAHAVRDWTNRTTGEVKPIHNLRMQVVSIKVA